MARKLGLTFPLGYGEHRALAARPYRPYSVPTTVFVGADGIIKALSQGRVHTDTLQRHLALILPTSAP